jgi:phytol kinase
VNETVAGWLAAPVTLSPWIGASIVLGLTGVLLGGVTWWRTVARPDGEHTRKAVHVGMGTIATALPWLFAGTAPVLALAGGLALVFVALKLFARRSALGEAMHDVGRDSRGDLYFAISVALLWLLARGDRLLFVVPVLVLTLGDATAALVGRRFGRRFFDDRHAGKSFEGSEALVLVTLLSVAAPLTLAGRTTPMAALLTAATLAVLVTLLEAMAWHGLDNVFVPIGAFLLLRTSIDLDTPSLTWRLVAAVACLGVVALARTRTTLRDAALAGAALAGYLVWALAGWWWLLPPLALFAVYTWLFPRLRASSAREHDLHAVAGVMLPALGWLFAGRLFDGVNAFVPYAATFVAQMAMIGVVDASARRRTDSPFLPLVLGCALLMLPVVLLVRPWALVPFASAAALAGATLAGIAINRGLDRVTPGLHLEPQWDRQARWALLASLVTLPLVLG